MKRAKKVLGGIAALALATFLAPGIALANDYTGDCASYPGSFDGTGNVTINDTNCVLSTSINAPNGSVQITADSISAGTNTISAGTQIDINSQAGDTQIGNLTASNHYIRARGNNITVGNIKTTTYGSVIVVAQGNLQLGDVEAATGYNVNIKAHASGGNSNLEIGSAGANKITKITVKGSANDQTYASSIVYVTNGNASSTGNLTLSDAAKISNASGSGKPGHIFLNAQSGTLTMPGATVASDGSGANHGGVIALLANTVSFGANAVVSATDPTASGGLHGVAIAAQTVNHSGLTLRGDGNGVDQWFTGYVELVPQGAITITESTDPASMWIYGHNIDHTKTGNITYAGTGSSAFTASAQGNNTRVYVFATKSTFSGGAATFDARGASTHTINFTTTGTGSGSDGIVFSGTGAVTLDASATAGGTGGNISLIVDKVVMDAPSIAVNANGPTSGNGNGGEIYAYTANGFALNASSTASFTANAASSGTGNAIYSDPASYSPKAISLYAGWSNSVKIGTGAGQFSFSANGGLNGGDAGAAIIAAANFQLMTANAVNLKALAGSGSGKGGSVRLLSYITAVDSGITAPVFTLTGYGTGIGGKFQSYHNITVTDVLTWVKVDGGTGLTTTDADFGRIILNNVPCQQRYVGSTWPKTYWNCANPDSTSVAKDKVPSDVAKSSAFDNLRTQFGDNKTEIFVFTGNTSYNSFWSDYFPATAGGLTFKSGQHIYSNPWQSGSRGAAAETYTDAMYEEVTSHELGHAVDIIFKGGGSTLPSNDTNWGSNNNRDTLFDLDQVLDPTINQMVHRFPCKKTPFSGGGESVNVPLAGVVYLPNGANVCLPNGDVNDAILQFGSWNQSTVTATQVISHIESILGMSKPEVHAHIFGWNAKHTKGARPMLDKVLDNGFFPCLKAWAATELSGSLPSSGACSAGLTP